LSKQNIGHALAKAGGKQLRDAISQAAETKSLTNVGDGDIHFSVFINVYFYYLVVISAAPNLSASHLIHVNSPTWNAGTQEQCIGELDKATLNILTLADEQGLTSVALPSISSGK
jgi:O-acetyl-ADP-ribose deacetylase (regulator of RNase III)